MFFSLIGCCSTVALFSSEFALLQQSAVSAMLLVFRFSLQDNALGTHFLHLLPSSCLIATRCGALD
jgi:hypothetical protein